MKRVKSPDIKTGVWIDLDNAIVVKMAGEKEPVVTEIDSSIETRVRFPGEGKRFARFGNTFMNDEEKKERRLHQQLVKYYKKIVSLIEDSGYLCIYGPGKRKLELQHYLENESHFHGRLMSCANAGKVKATHFAGKVVSYFGGDEFREIRKKEKKESRSGVAGGSS
ncbi:MAG: hypothetical protein IPH18_00095 [Chitinophagaceae bacterium]|nr:hypothetical protein [Chitinophagaceae bacterium]